MKRFLLIFLFFILQISAQSQWIDNGIGEQGVSGNISTNGFSVLTPNTSTPWVCSSLNLSSFPLSAVSTPLLFNGVQTVLRSEMAMTFAQMANSDSGSFALQFKRSLPYKSSQLLGDGYAGYNIDDSLGVISVYNKIGGKKTIYNLGTTDSTWHTVLVQINGTTTKTYFDDVLTHTYTSYSWLNAYVNNPFTIGHGNITTFASGFGNLPSATTLYYKGYIGYVRIHNYYGTLDSANLNYNMKSNGVFCYDSTTYLIATEGTGNSRHLDLGYMSGSVNSASPIYELQSTYNSKAVSPLSLLFISGSGDTASGQVWCMCKLGSGDTAIVLAGSYNRNGSTVINGIGIYNIPNNSFRAMGSGVDDGYPERVDNKGDTIFTCGTFTSMAGVSNTKHIAYATSSDGHATWTWHSLDTIGLNDNARCIRWLNDTLRVGGIFDTVGTTICHKIANWKFGGHFTALGTGTNGEVEDVAYLNNTLYVGGRMTTAGGITVNMTASYTGGTWHSLGTGTNQSRQTVVYCLGLWKNKVIWGGDFDAINGITGNVFSYDGSVWNPIASTSGRLNYALALATYKTDGVNDELYVAGSFTYAGGRPVNGAFRTDGNSVCNAFGYGASDGLRIWNLININNYSMYGCGNNYNIDFTPVRLFWKYVQSDTASPVISNVSISSVLQSNYPPTISATVTSEINSLDSVYVDAHIGANGTPFHFKLTASGNTYSAPFTSKTTAIGDTVIYVLSAKNKVPKTTTYSSNFILTGFPNIVLDHEWWADSNVTSSSNSVSVWGSTVDTMKMRQSTGGNQPTYVAGYMANGLGAIRFTRASSSFFNIPTLSASANEGATIFIVYRVVSFDAVADIAFGGTNQQIQFDLHATNYGWSIVNPSPIGIVSPYSGTDTARVIRTCTLDSLWSNGSRMSYSVSSSSRTSTGVSFQFFGKRSDGYYPDVYIIYIGWKQGNMIGADIITKHAWLNNKLGIY